MLALVLWCFLFCFCWPIALLALALYPILWLLTLPLRILGIAVHGVFACSPPCSCSRSPAPRPSPDLTLAPRGGFAGARLRPT